MDVAQVVKHEWPHNWPRFIPDLTGAAKSSETMCENCMNILKVRTLTTAPHSPLSVHHIRTHIVMTASLILVYQTEFCRIRPDPRARGIRAFALTGKPLPPRDGALSAILLCYVGLQALRESQFLSIPRSFVSPLRTSHDVTPRVDMLKRQR
eukprot:2585172-Pyramimonas_sp.AAC.1